MWAKQVAEAFLRGFAASGDLVGEVKVELASEFLVGERDDAPGRLGGTKAGDGFFCFGESFQDALLSGGDGWAVELTRRGTAR
ncbi:MAG: hypothetical protein EXS40_09905 [Opitutaceae bacterium]|nr:hypothetical protein [Opitutaceae bacterium]